MLRGGAAAVMAGIVAGVPLLWAATRLIASRLFADLAGSPAVYLVAAGALTLTALLATYLPARRATRIDPLRAMRDS